MTVGIICNREVVVAHKDTSILEAASLMREYHVGDLIIVEDNGNLRTPVGIVTDRDIVIETVAKGIDPESVTVGDIMSYEIAVARENDDLLDSLKQMRGKGVRRMPVVDDVEGLVGIVTVDDMIELLAEQLRDIADLIGKERKNEEIQYE
ncbi:MAG: CBS domain-containing protein [Gammaproteobacteria bacterium]